MAKAKKTSLEITPIMGLSMMAIFVMMPVIFFAANSNKVARESRAAENKMMVEDELMMEEATPTPSSVGY